MIGSHSGKFCATNLQTGDLFWEVTLPDRIESSACLSPDGSSIIVGCYDGHIYCLAVNTGRLRWSHATGDVVKSSPLATISLIFCGSHDKHLYALCIKTGNCVWKQKIGEGSLFSSPSLTEDSTQLFSADLSGTLASLDPSTGKIGWRTKVGSPIFSSPLVQESRVCVGSVDHHMYCWDLQGQLMWKVDTDGPIFSSPSLLKGNSLLVVGSHSGFLHCLCLSTGAARWRYQGQAAIYATPSSSNQLTVSGSINGTLALLEQDSGIQQATLDLPGALFSSPIMVGNKVVVGCRDNFLYCLHFSSSSSVS